MRSNRTTFTKYQSSFKSSQPIINADLEEEEPVQDLDKKIIDGDLVFKVAMTRDLKGLKELEITMEKLTEIDAGNQTIRQLTNLQHLSLAENYLARIQNLDTVRTLTSLCLSDNRIKRLENLNLPQLVNLDVSYNKIAVLENLSKLKKLENLNLSYNLLTEAGVSGKAY